MQGWADVSEHIPAALASAACEAAGFLADIQKAERGLTLATFVRASTAVSRLPFNKHVTVLTKYMEDCRGLGRGKGINILRLTQLIPPALPYEQQSRCRGQAPQLALPDGFEKLVESFTKVPHNTASLPMAWFKLLRSNGHLDEMLNLEASVQSQIGSDVQRHLRVARVLQQVTTTPDDQKPGWMLGQMDVKNDFKHCMINLLDITAILRGEAGSDFASEEMKSCVETLTKCLQEAIAAVTEGMAGAKKTCMPFYQKLKTLQQALSGDDKDNATAVLKSITGDDGQRVMKDIVQGHLSLIGRVVITNATTTRWQLGRVVGLPYSHIVHSLVT